MDQRSEPRMNGQDGAAAVEPVLRVGGRSPSAQATGCASTASGERPLAPARRWRVAGKRAVVLRLLAGESIALLSREPGGPVAKLKR